MTLRESLIENSERKNEAYREMKLAERAGDKDTADHHKRRYDMFSFAISEIYIEMRSKIN